VASWALGAARATLQAWCFLAHLLSHSALLLWRWMRAPPPPSLPAPRMPRLRPRPRAPVRPPAGSPRMRRRARRRRAARMRARAAAAATAAAALAPRAAGENRGALAAPVRGQWGMARAAASEALDAARAALRMLSPQGPLLPLSLPPLRRWLGAPPRAPPTPPAPPAPPAPQPHAPERPPCRGSPRTRFHA
jgi:hypothetical protein